MAGDFNCGLANSAYDISEELAQSCHLINQHFQDPAANLNKCSYCSDNLINRASGETKNYFIDHVYTKGFNAISVKRTKDQSIIIKKKKEKFRTNLSDHYGIQVTVD
jgi:endonuclease/exonuclease/phosphatase family metal-dependent hydrolase